MDSILNIVNAVSDPIILHFIFNVPTHVVAPFNFVDQGRAKRAEAETDLP